MRTKNKSFPIRMKEEEYNIIKAKAEIEGVSVAEFMRVASLNKRVDGFKKATISGNDNLEGQISISDMEV